MKSIVVYNRKNNLLENSKNSIPTFCQKNCGDSKKKCQKHYNQILNEENELIKCPYGFYSIAKTNNIYTSIILEEDMADSKEKLKLYNEKITQYKTYTTEELFDYIDDIEYLENQKQELKKENNSLKDCTHDLGNIGTYFNSMSSRVKTKYSEICEQDNDVKAMLCLYEMMNYRINITSSIPVSGYRKQIIKLHPLLEKLKIMMSYKANNKDSKITIEPNDDYVMASENLYIAMFIVIDNAVKYTPSRGNVEIYFEKKDKTISINVSNIGPKIEPFEKDKLTERSYRGFNNNSTGQGIGLSVYKEICEKGNYGFEINQKSINSNQDLFIVSTTLELAEYPQDSSK